VYDSLNVLIGADVLLKNKKYVSSNENSFLIGNGILNAN